MKYKVFAFLASGAWIGASEFLRNEILFKSYWLDKYQSLGITFPSAMANNAVWGIWSFVLAADVLFLVLRLRLIEAIGVAWVMGFVMMWLVIGNLNVLPYRLLLAAVPLSLLEVSVAAIIDRRIARWSRRSDRE